MEIEMKVVVQAANETIELYWEGYEFDKAIDRLKEFKEQVVSNADR